jgi:lysophospholipase L1-like esterase
MDVSLPRVARKLAANEPVTIVAFGSSSTAGAGASSVAHTYPVRLAEQLRRAFPKATIKVVNQGINGEDAMQMIPRLQGSVMSQSPDLVIWQLGTNAVIHNEDIDTTGKLMADGIRQIRASGADLVLIDPQYAPAVTAKKEQAGRMIALMHRAARSARVGLFPRFAVMQSWHEDQALPIETFVAGDGLHMNDWGYACFAQLLGDTIIKSVKQTQAGIEMPSAILTFQPM